MRVSEDIIQLFEAPSPHLHKRKADHKDPYKVDCEVQKVETPWGVGDTHRSGVRVYKANNATRSLWSAK